MKKQSSVLAWLLGACLGAELLPDLVMTMWTLKAEEPLSGGFSLGVGFAASCLAFLFFLISVYLSFGREPADAGEPADWKSYLLGCFPCLLVFLVFLYGSRPMTPILAAVYGAGKGLFLLLMCVLALALCTLLGMAFFGWMCSCRKTPVSHPIRRFFSKLYLGIPMAALLWAAIFTVPSAQVLVGDGWNELPVILRHLILMAGSVLMAGFLYGALVLADQMMVKADVVSEKEAKPFWRQYLPQILALSFCTLLFLSQNFIQLIGSQAAILNAQMKDYLTEYGFYLAALDTRRAVEIAEEAVEQMDAALLSVEEEKKEAREDASAVRKAEKKKKSLEKVCNRYEIFRTDGKALSLLEQFKKNGGAEEELVEEVLLLSEEQPDNLWIQYTAAHIASSLTYDDAKHYDRTARAILRCEELYRREKKPADGERIAFGKNMAQMLLAVYHEEEAEALLLELFDVSGQGDREISQLLAQCYERRGKLSEAYELASSYCEEQGDSPYLMYCAALSALKLEKMEECLRYTSRLASYTAGCDGEEGKACDVWLFGMLEYLTLNDNSKYTDFQYDVYRKLTEEENTLIDENTFFRNYLDAVYLAYRSDHKEETEEAFRKMEMVLAENPNLASAWYLCGILASNSREQEDWETAVAFYETAGTLNGEIPAVWYAMAREYDRMGEYEKGIEACKKALALLPEQDHGTDWYGINYHCSRLLRSLQNAVK